MTPSKRFYSHASKEWWHSVSHKSIEWFDTAKDASRAERMAIESELPLHNKAGVHSPYIQYAGEHSSPTSTNPNELTALTVEQAALARCDQEVKDARAYRDHMIRAAREAGHTWQAIQDATGLTPHAVALAIKRN